MNIRQASAAYEVWLRSHLGTVREDLRLKHARMSESPFTFMRATFFRWAQLFPDKCRPLADAASVLGVGDLHIENFGTWRDAEGRLVWGVNDFDEADRVPFTNDLVRLSTSATIAIAAGHLALQAREAAELMLQGYEESLQHGGQPIVLAEHHHALGVMARFRLHDAERYWSTLQAMPTVRTVRPDVAKLLARALPDRDLSHRVVHRVAGLGSLGRERYVAIAEWDGGLVAREAKPLAPSAQRWATGHDSRKIRYRAILDGAIRCRDPFVAVRGRWLVRRLAPDCSRIDLADLPQERDEERLLHAMGWETANVHLGSRSAKRLRADLQRLPRRWLTDASKSMAETITKEWKAWRSD